MKLIELDPHFCRREIRPCSPGPHCTMVSPHTSHEVHVYVDTIDQADGLYLLCPKCFAANAGPKGTHAVLCWRPRVPPDVDPKPGRWEFLGTGFHDLTLRAGSSSILLTSGCAAHFFVDSGQIRMC